MVMYFFGWDGVFMLAVMAAHFVNSYEQNLIDNVVLFSLKGSVLA